jgi:hypothetical protein
MATVWSSMITDVEMYRARLRAAHEQLSHAAKHLSDPIPPHHPLNDALNDVINALHLTTMPVTTEHDTQPQEELCESDPPSTASTAASPSSPQTAPPQKSKPSSAPSARATLPIPNVGAPRPVPARRSPAEIADAEAAAPAQGEQG